MLARPRLGKLYPTGGLVVERTLVERYWNDGGTRVERWRNDEGTLVERWRNDEGTLVER